MASVLDSIVDNETQDCHFGRVPVLDVKVSADDLGHCSRSLFAVSQNSLAEAGAIASSMPEYSILAKVIFVVESGLAQTLMLSEGRQRLLDHQEVSGLHPHALALVGLIEDSFDQGHFPFVDERVNLLLYQGYEVTGVLPGEVEVLQNLIAVHLRIYIIENPSVEYLNFVIDLNFQQQIPQHPCKRGETLEVSWHSAWANNNVDIISDIIMQTEIVRPKPKDYIDLRSDVISVPPNEMLQAMSKAEVGDDVFEDDPTANKFQQTIAQYFGFEASMIVPSTTMANLISVLLTSKPGDEVIVWGNSHTIQREGAGIAAICGVQTRQILQDSGIFSLESIKKRVRKQAQHITFPNTSLIFVENPTFTGQVWPLQALSQLKAYAEKEGVKVIMDGARITNAIAYYGCEPKLMGSLCDVMTMCLSKGLCCPFGSLVFGSAQMIKEARHIRKSLGGGMRQIGIIGAAGMYALEHIIPEIKIDNEMVQYLGAQLGQIAGMEVDIARAHSNILNFRVRIENFNHNEYYLYLLENMVKIKPFNEDRQEYRVVTHRTIRKGECDKFIRLTKQYFLSYGKEPAAGRGAGGAGREEMIYR